MHILTLIERAASKVSTIFNAALRAERSLGYEAQTALERWLSYNWTDSKLSKDFQAGRTGTFDEIYRAAEPVRQEIRRVYGDSVLLYRGMKHQTPGEGYDMSDKRLYSWTFDEKVADGYAFPNRKWEHKPLTDEQIDQFVARYEEVGFVQVGGHYYKRNARYPDFYDIYDRNRQHVTDGDDLRAELKSTQSDREEMVADNLSKGAVAAKQIPVQDIVWLATTSEKEVIVIGHSG